MAEKSPISKPPSPNLGSLAAREPGQEIKGYIRNMILYDDLGQTEFNDTMDFWFRPTVVNEQGRANYKETEVLGMSHKLRTFSSTQNFKFIFDLYFNTLMRVKQFASRQGRGSAVGDYNDLVLLSDDIESKRRFLEALVIPYEDASGMLSGENPPVILVIPGIVNMRCKLDSFSFEFRDCTLEGKVKELMCRLEFTEEPLGRITMRQHLATGCQRMWGR